MIYNIEMCWDGHVKTWRDTLTRAIHTVTDSRYTKGKVLKTVKHPCPFQSSYAHKCYHKRIIVEVKDTV